MSSSGKLAEQIQQFRRDGFVVIGDAIEPELVTALKAALTRLETEGGFGYRDTAFEGTRTVRIYNLLVHDPIFARVPIQPKVLDLAEALLDPGLLLSSLSAITLGPDQAAQPIHADSQLIPLPRPHPTIAVNAMWALSDFTAANGATRVIPGSHLRDQTPAYQGSYETVAAEMRAGSVMLFDSQLWHGGGTNTTQEKRFAIACYYCAGWIRQQENQQLGVPLELARGFPRRLQELMGYSVYEGLYGHIDNRDPIELLGQDPGSKMIWQASNEKIHR